MYRRESRRFTGVKEEQFLNAPSPICTTDSAPCRYLRVEPRNDQLRLSLRRGAEFLRIGR